MVRSETEFKWIVNLLNSSYVKGWFKSTGGCEKDFERISGSGENNNQFAKWFAYLLEVGAIEPYGIVKTHKNSVQAFIIIYKKLIKVLSNNDLYNPTKKIMYKEYENLK